MQIDWNHFTPLTSLAGGIAIGLAAAIYVRWVGRIAGMLLHDNVWARRQRKVAPA